MQTESSGNSKVAWQGTVGQSAGKQECRANQAPCLAFLISFCRRDFKRAAWFRWISLLVPARSSRFAVTR